jgi:uncharacterized protein YbcI
MTSQEQLHGGPLAAAITTELVQVFSRYAGRGPTQGRTLINDNVVSCLLRDTLTKAERSLVQDDKEDLVLEVRRTFQQTMREDLIGSVERLTGREVVVFMSSNHIDPDIALETFVLEPELDEEHPFHPRD